MRNIFNSLPNFLTAIRILLLPILWVIALLGYPVALGWVLLVAFFTDAVDGPLARLTGHVTQFGSKFDSIADALLGVSSAIWLILICDCAESSSLCAWALTVSSRSRSGSCPRVGAANPKKTPQNTTATRRRGATRGVPFRAPIGVPFNE